MAEVLVEFESEFESPDHGRFTARACGRERPEGLWECWLEFTPRAGGAVVRTGRESTQPSRDAARYWATGLTTTYIDGALARTLVPALPHVGDREVNAEPAYTGPAHSSKPVLDPYQVYTEGESVLRAQLSALDERQLRTIGLAFGVADPDRLKIADRTDLIALIMLSAEERVA